MEFTYDAYCKMYIDIKLFKSELITYIASIIKGKVNLKSINSNFMEIDVFKNDDFDLDKKQEQDGFVYYPFYLEITYCVHEFRRLKK